MSAGDASDLAYCRSLLDHCALVSPSYRGTVVGLAWDNYLEAAARLEPKVLESLFTEEAINGKTEDARRPGLRLEETETGLFIAAWCRRWGFHRDYAFNPAWNTLNRANRATQAGTPFPDEFTCSWSGQSYAKWEHDDGRQRLGGIAGMPGHDDADEWNPDGAPHPFAELAGRLMAHGGFQVVGGNGIHPFPAHYAARQGTQVVLDLPMMYWDPTAETRAEAHTRIIGLIGTLLDADLDTVERAYRANGYQSPPEKRARRHFEWLFRYQVLRERKADIATAEDVGERHVRREVEYTARLLGLRPRIERRGRPRRKTGNTVKFSGSRK